MPPKRKNIHKINRRRSPRVARRELQTVHEDFDEDSHLESEEIPSEDASSFREEDEEEEDIAKAVEDMRTEARFFSECLSCSI